MERLGWEGRRSHPGRAPCGTVPVLQPSIQGHLVLTPRCTHAFARMHTKHTATCTHNGMLSGLCTVCKTGVRSHTQRARAHKHHGAHTCAFIIILSCFEHDICTRTGHATHISMLRGAYGSVHTHVPAHTCTEALAHPPRHAPTHCSSHPGCFSPARDLFTCLRLINGFWQPH